MSYINKTLPTIAITPDEGLNNNDVNNIQEVATDVEDMYFHTEKRKKKSKKHTIKKDAYATDIEDVEGSDEEFVAPLIKHSNPISLNDLMAEEEIPLVEEIYKSDKKKSVKKPKLISQASVSSSLHFLQPDEIESFQILTDQEDFEGSDYEEDEVSNKDFSDTDLLEEIIHDTGSIAISDSVKKFLQAVPSPMITPIQDLSDTDDFKLSKNSKLFLTEKRTGAHYISPSSISPHLSDITDTEIVHYDSNDEIIRCKQKHKYSNRGRRHTLPQKNKLDTTDSDDMDLSENEMTKQRRITVSDISKTSVQKLKSKSISKKNSCQEMNSKFCDISKAVHESESDEETNSVLYPVNNNSIKKKPKIFLKVRRDSNEGLTDTELMEGDNTIDEEKFYEDNSINISTEFESNNGIVQETMSIKESKDLNKLAEIRLMRKEDRKSLEGNETDEEEEISECEKNDESIDNTKDFEISFINMSKINKNIEEKKYNKKKLCIPTNTNTEVLTDTENLNSSSDDNEYEKPIPVSVIGNEAIGQDTDTESIKSETEYKFSEKQVPESYIPSVSRKLIKETETAGNVSKISSTTLNNDSDSFETEISNIKTDIEEFSGDEINEENFTDKFALDIDFNDGGKIEYKDILRVPSNRNLSECETDTEDINSLQKQKSTKKANALLCVLNDDVDKLTDTEDLELSDKENIKNYDCLEIVAIDNTANSKTDIEDFDASDNDQEQTNTDYCRTPDILRQMEGQTICSQDGDGYFTKRDIENLNNKHETMGITEISPSPTFTDEIITSADEENYSRAETATPLQMTEELNEAVSHKVHSQSTKKINLEADDEVMYLKGGGFFPDAITDTEEMGISDEESVINNDRSSINLMSKLNLNMNKNDENYKQNFANNTAYNQITFLWKEEFNQEWSPAAKGTSTAGEKGGDEPVGDAAHQDTRAARLGYNAGNQRTFGASCSKPESSSSYLTSTHVIPSNTQISSYTQLDQILDHMLAEVDEQEKLVELDASQKTLSPICVNSFKLVPTTDAIIELSISQMQNTPKLFETKHEIIINDQVEQNFNDNFDLDDDISLKTLNKSQDTDSLFSFESISEIYFLENMSNKYKASCESLGELDTNNTLPEKIIDDEHIYEIIEPNNDLNSLVHDDKQEIWWEGTYRDLSIVPEEDEDNTSEINELQNYIPEHKYEVNESFSKDNLNETSKVHDDCDNVSHCSSSEFSQITGDEYDTSDVENNFNKLSNMPVKAEVKLLVKTSDRGKEDIEIRSVKEFTEQIKPNNSINCDIDNKNNFESISQRHQKPTYTLQRLFVRGSDNTSVYKEFPKQYPDQLIVTSKAQFPLQYHTSETNTQNLHKNKKNKVDLFANSPFYPCYETYDTQKCSSNSFPTAYCDWLLQPDDDIGGKTTSPSILVRNEVNVVTGESLIHDTMSKDLTPIINETKSLIKMESETDNDNACVKTNVPSQLTVKSTEPEKATKELDNKKEKSKSKGGFFSSLKSLVGRSFDSSDSESKEEKTPKKKKKKDKSTPKKTKKEKTDKAEIAEIKPIQKSPELAQKPHALYESNELDNIPPIDEIEGNNIQVTDLDAEVCLNEDIKIKAKTIVNTVINDSEKAASNMLNDKIQEFNLEGTVTPEEVRRSTEPIIINEDEFLVVIEPKLNNDYEDIQCRDDKINETSLTVNLADMSETNSDTLKSRKSTGFLKLFGKKDSKESDDETRTEEEKQDHTEHRKSTGFFGMFSKKPKEEEKKEEIKNIILKEEPGIHYSTVNREFSKEVQQQMVDTAHFLMTEVEHFEDAKLDYSEIKKLEQMSLSKEVQQHMVESAHFLRTEIELFEDVRPQKVTEKEVQKEIPCEEKTVKDSDKAQNLCISEEVQQQMLDTSHFLLKEIELFDDVKKREEQTESQKNLQSIKSKNDILNSSNEVEYKMSKTTDEKIEEQPHVSIQLQTINEMKVENKTEEPPNTQGKNNVQDNETGESKSHGFFSKLGFGGKVTEKKDESKDKKKNKRKKEKKPGFFSKIGEKFSSGSEDKTCLSSEDELKLSENEDAPASLVKNLNTVKVTLDEKTSVKQLKDTLTNTEDLPKSTNALIKDNVSDFKESSVLIKDLEKEKFKESITNKDAVADIEQNLQDAMKERTENLVNFEETVKDLTQNAEKKLLDSKELVENITQSTVQKASELSSDALEKTSEITNDVKQTLKYAVDDIKDEVKSSNYKTIEKIEEKLKPAKEVTTKSTEKVSDFVQDAFATVISPKDAASFKVEDNVKNITQDIKDGAKNTEGIFGEISEKIKSSVNSAQEDLDTNVTQGKEKMDVSKEHVKDTAQNTVDKLTDISITAKQKTNVVADEIKKEVIKSKDTATEKVNETLQSAKEITQASTDKVKDFVQDATESAISLKDAATAKVIESLDNLKEDVRDGPQKTESFFSELAESVESSVKDAQKDVNTTAALSKANIDESKKQVKEIAQSTKEKASEITNAAKQKTKNFADGIKDEVKSTKDKSTEKVKETLETAKEVTQASTEKVKDFVQDATERVKLSKDEATTKAQETLTNIKEDVKDGSKKTEGFFSGLGKKIKGSVKETQEDLKTTAEISKEKIEESKEHVKNIAQSTVEKASDISSAAKQNTKVVADDIKKGFETSKDKGSEKVKETFQSAKEITQASTEKVKDFVQDATENAISSKDAATTKAKESLDNLKEDLRDGSKKTEGFFSGLAESVKSSVKGAQKDVNTAAALSKAKIDESKEQVKEIAQDTKEKASEITTAAKQKTKYVGYDIKEEVKSTKDKSAEKVKETLETAKEVTQPSTEKVKDLVQDASERVKLSKDEATTKAQETLTNIKEDVKDGSKKTEGFFSGLGKKIKGSVKGAQEDLKTTAAISKEKIDESKEHVKDIAQSTAEKASDISSAAEQKTKVVADDIKKGFKTSKDKGSEKVKETFQSAKEITQASTEKVKDFAQDATENAISSKDAATTKAKESLDNLKEDLRDGSKKTEGFFSGLAESVESSVKDAQKDVNTAAALSKAKIDESKEQVKETAQGTKVKASEITTAAKQKTKNVADDIKEEVKSTKDKSAEKVKETLETVKEVTQASTEKVKDLVQDASERVKLSKDEATTKAQETLTNIKEDIKDGSKKTEGFFSGLGKKIKGSVKGAQEDLKTTAAISKENIDESKEHVKDIAQSSAKKASDISSAAEQKTKVVADDIKKGFETSKDKGSEKVKETFQSAKEITQASTEKVKDFVQDATENAISSKDAATTKAKESLDNLKEDLRDGSKKTEGFFSGLAESVESSVKDAQKDVNTAAALSKAKIDESKEQVKKIAQGTKEKASEITTAAKQKTKNVADDIKEEVKSTKDKSAEKVKETLETAKEVTQASAEKVKDLVQDASERVKLSKDEATTKAQETLTNIKEDIKDGSKKTEGFFSGLGKKIKGSVKGAQEDLKTTAAISKENIDESKEHVKDIAQSSAKKASDISSAAEQKTKVVADDIKKGFETSKDKGSEKVKETFQSAKEITQASTEKVKDFVQDATENAISSKDAATTKAKESLDNLKEDLRDGSKKTEGFFSGLAESVESSVKDAQKDVNTAAALSKAKIDESKEQVKKIAQGTKEKASEITTAAKQKTKNVADDIKEEVKSTKDKSAEKVKETLETAKEVTQASAEKVKDLVQDASERVKLSKDEATTKAQETLTNIKEDVKDGSKKTEGFFSGLGKKIKGSVKGAQEDLKTTAAISKEKIDESKEHVKDIAQSTAEKVSDISSAAEQKTKVVADDIKKEFKTSKDKDTEKVKETLQSAKEITQASTEKVKDFVQDATESAISSKDAATAKSKESLDNLKEDVRDGSQKTEGFFSGIAERVEGSVKDAQKDLNTTAALSKAKIDESKAQVKEIAQSTKEKASEITTAAKQKTKNIADHVKDKVKSTKDKGTEKVKETLETAKEVTQASTEKVKDLVQDASDRMKLSKDEATIKAQETLTNIKEDVKDGSKKTEGFFSGLGKKIKGSVRGAQEDLKTTAAINKEKIDESKEHVKDIAQSTVEKVADISSAAEQKIKIVTNDTEKGSKTDVDDKSFKDTKNEFICFVTTPTMQRKGIGGSQRLTKYDRPALMDVSNMPVDSSSDEDEYIVTEPGEKQIDGNISSCGSSIVIETIQENEEEDTDKKNEMTSNTLDAKKRPLFHIGSKDDESYSESIDLGDQIESERMHTKRESESESTINNDAFKSDIDIIENKLLLLGKALDDLEQVNNDLEPLESSTDDKNERKLRRVERRFERMASETMEKDSTDAKEKQMTSPEIEAKREDDFRTIVSQLSQEEVSECQKLYSSLWDDATFTPSEEWDSKTPDSQPDDIQELPPGEVVYMGPVTLNKDHLINKAGIEVDVIPIKRSPCTSPLPKRKLQNKGRAKSAMGFYKEKQFEERGSLPDLQNTGKINDKKLNIQKGSIMSAILKSNPNILKDSVSSINSTNSEYFNLGNDKSLTRRQSTESFIKGSIVTAVKEWMEKSTPFGSTDNVRSTDAISLADTNISIFDDDDNDSVDLQSDSAYQMETESSKSDNYIPDIFVTNDNFVPSNLYDSFQYVNKNQSGNDFGIPTTSITRKVFSALDQFSVGETSGGPLTKLTSEASSHLATNLKQPVELTPIPKPKPRTDKTPEANKVVTSAFTSENLETNVPETSELLDETPESYSDRKKFWENVSASKKEEEKYEISVKKRMSLFEDQTNKQEQETICTKKRTSVHEINVVPPVPKPRSTINQTSSEDSNNENQLHEIKENIEEHKEVFVSEYKAAFKDPSLVTDQPSRPESLEDESSVVSTIEQKPISGKSESIDSEHEYLKYEHQAYENPGYISESDQEADQSIKDEELDSVPIIKRRQMSISQPPVAATRKTIFERSASLPTDNLQDVCEKSVKARKQYFEQQIKNEMVIDQLMTQLEEEEPQEYKTLTDATECKTIKTPEEKIKIETVVLSVRETEKDIEKDLKDIEKKMSPISSSSSQDTRTEDDITQYTPTSVKDLAKYFQPNLINDFIPGTKTQKEIISKTNEITKELQFSTMETENISKTTYTQETDVKESKDLITDNEPLKQMQQSSTDSEQSISSERSIELGSVDELPTQIAEVLQYKSDSISKPSDSLEVHVDKSEIEDSEKVTDATDIENKSLSAEEYLSDIMDQESKAIDKIDSVTEVLISNENLNDQLISPLKEHKEQIVDTTWEVSIESQPLTEITESVVEIPIERQIIVEKDEELSSSARDESDLGSEIHQDHSESNESERIKSDHSEVEQLILESLYHQKINPEDARKIASELVDDIETEIERRNLIESNQLDDLEPPAPPAEVAKNQISDYLRQLAEAKGLDAKEVELVETVLARKQSELSKLGRHDTQTSSMEITDEDLKYSGADYDISPSESHENILEEQIEQLEFESQFSDKNEKSNEDEVKFSEKSSDSTIKDIHAQQDRKYYDENQTLVSVKTETIGTVSNISDEQKDVLKKSEQIIDENILMEKKSEDILDMKTEQEKIILSTDIKIASDSATYQEKISTDVTDNEQREHREKNRSSKTVTDMIESEEKIVDEFDKQNICMQGTKDAEIITHEETEESIVDTKKYEITKALGDLNEEKQSKLEHKHEILTADDGSQIISEEIKEEVHFKTVSKSHIIDHKREEKTSISYIQDSKEEPGINLSDESKSSTYESAKSPGEQVSSSSSLRKDDTDTSNILEKPEVIFRKKIRKDLDTSSSSGNLKLDNRKSGADFEAYSSSGESHYHSFDQDSARSRPCSSDVEGLLAAGSSEYESALTSQDVSSKSHITSTEYHTAVSSISSQSMKSLDSESSGHLGSIEVSEASETLVASEVPSNFDLEGDILDGAMSQLLEDEVADSGPNEIIEPYDREIPEHVIRGEYTIQDKKSSFDTISDSDIHGESMDISEEDSPHEKNLPGEITGKMKRSQEMTFQPIPKAIIPDSPQSDALEMDERFGTSLEDGSVLSMSLSSQSDATALRTVIEQSRRDSDRLDGSMTTSGHDSISASNISLDNIIPPLSSAVDTSTSTGTHGQETLSSVTLTTSTIDENGTQSVSTQVTSKSTVQQDDVHNGPTQVDYVPEYDDVVEPKKIRGHRRQESTSFAPSMIPGFIPRTDIFKTTEPTISTTEKHVSEMTLKEVYHEETKDVDETEESYETEADQGYYRQQKESGTLDTESDQDADKDDNESRPHSRISKTDSEIERGMSAAISEDKPDSELVALMNEGSVDIVSEPIERPLTPEPPLDSRGSIDGIPSLPTTPKSKICGSEKSIEEGEAEAAFSMVAHVSPAHKAKGDICPIIEDEDAEKHELETREKAQKEMERKRAQILRDQSPGNIPDIMVTEHMTPLVDREFHYPDLELEEKEALAKSAPQTPASVSSKSSEETDQGREYVLDDSHQVIPEEPELEINAEDKQMTESKSEISQSTTVDERTIYESNAKEPGSLADSPNSDSFEILEKPDIIDDFVVIEEVAKEAAEHDMEGKSVKIKQTKYIRKHDEEVEEYLVKSAPTPLTRMTELKYYPDGASSGDELGPFDFEDSPPQAGKKSTNIKTTKTDPNAAQSFGMEYDRELEASKKWIEMQFQGDQAAMISAGYGYEMEFERGPLEDIKEEEATDFESSRIGSLDSQKQSIGSLGSVKDSFSSTPEYDVLAGRKFFTRSGEHDDISMSSLQEFEHLERVISLENRRHHQGSQDSSSNGSFSKRYHASRSGQGDDVSMSSLKEFEGLETACIEAHIIEVKAKEEEALLTQIDEAQESLISESESCKSVSSADKKNLPESEEEDYEKRMFEIDEIIKQAQSNVEKFIDMKELADKTESMGRGDSLEEVAKVPDLELDEPLVKSTVHTVKWGTDDIMQTSTDSLEEKPEHRTSIDSLDMKTTAADIMTTSTDSIEFHIQSKSTKNNLMTDSIEIPDQDRSCMITSDSLELTPGALTQLAHMSDSIDEDGSRIGTIAHDQSSSSGFSMGKDEQDMQDQRAEYLLGSTDSLEPSSSTATHATYQYETDSVMSGSFTSGGSNTMVSSTDTIDPLTGQAHGVDLASAVRKVWFDEDAFEAGTHFTSELLDDGSRPYVTEVIEPCEGDTEYSHTIHRKVQLPPEIKKITFKGPDADLQLRQYIENFGEGEDVQETQETDKDGNIHVKRVVQKRFIVKADPSGEEKRISGPELESYLQEVSQTGDEYDLSYRDPSECGLTKTTITDHDGTKTIYGQKFTTNYFEGQSEESALKELLSSIASDVTQSSVHSEQNLIRHIDKQTEQPTGQSSATFSGATAANILRAQGCRRKPLRFDISVDDQTEVDPREHDWRFILPRHDEATAEEKSDTNESSQVTSQQRGVTDQHQLSSEMKELLEEMEKQSKQ